MQFDQCEFDKTQIVIKAGRIFRELRGLPKEKNITVLYNDAAKELGLEPVKMNSKIANRLPTLSEMQDKNGKFIVPRKDCPKCGKKDSYLLSSICPSCKDSEGGKYHSCWKCNEKTGGCGYVGDKSEKFFMQRMRDEFPDIVIPDGSKLSLGIMTNTDDGLK